MRIGDSPRRSTGWQRRQQRQRSASAGTRAAAETAAAETAEAAAETAEAAAGQAGAGTRAVQAAAGTRAVQAAAARNRGSLQLRHVDAGSCNGCEMEIASIFSPVYDAEQFGIRLEASPRHCDGLLVTGPVTNNMAGPLRKTLEAVPRPRVVIALGDCARDCGVFKGAYGVEGAVGDVVPVDLEIPGCPPHPAAIVAALRQVAGT